MNLKVYNKANFGISLPVLVYFSLLLLFIYLVFVACAFLSFFCLIYVSYELGLCQVIVLRMD